MSRSIIIVVVLLLVFLLAPYPHYDKAESTWFTGPSVAARLLGTNTTQNGVALDAVVVSIASSAVSSPFELSCSTNEDCQNYVVQYQCKQFCGNNQPGNNEIRNQLNNRRSCDTGMWRRPAFNCYCVHGQCINL